MDPAIVSAMAAVLGSLVGGAATFATAWVTQRTLSKRELLGAEIRTRETLYGEFIRACSKLVIDSFERALTSRRRCCLRISCSIGFGSAYPTRFLPRRSRCCSGSRNNTSRPISR